MFRVIRPTKFPIGYSLMPGEDSLPVRANESFMIIKALFGLIASHHGSMNEACVGLSSTTCGSPKSWAPQPPLPPPSPPRGINS
ncbi:hypothetical protein VNO80_11040 [Phaseolus coccineus]|uniref:Uncharacterized protein n=1 Tax=Phaseolus coccineus TaxID=3886 RepID=A0AAN9RDZ8_PHACN